MTTTSPVHRIAAAVRDGQLALAQALFTRAYAAVKEDDARTDLLVELAQTAEIPGDAILVAHMVRLTNNPMRVAYGWRCGPCTQAWIAGTAIPSTGNNYKTVTGAVRGARVHAAEHLGIQIVVNDDDPFAVRGGVS